MVLLNLIYYQFANHLCVVINCFRFLILFVINFNYFPREDIMKYHITYLKINIRKKQAIY